MKKYIIPVAAFMLIAGAVNAQVTPQKTNGATPAAKMSKTADKKVAATATVSPSTSATGKKTSTNTDATGIKRKHTKKHKSVKPVSNK